MKPRSELVLGVGAGIFLLRAYAQGHLGAFWSTLWGGSAKVATASPSLSDLASGALSGSLAGAQDVSGDPMGPYSIPKQGGSGPASKIFGFDASSFFDYIVGGMDPNVKAQDTAGLQVYGGSKEKATHDYDYGFTGDSPVVKLPVTAQYEGFNSSPNWGNALIFRLQNGGLIEFMHLGGPSIGGATASLVPGRTYGAGTPVGRPATNLPKSSNWTGPHLSVITDAAGAAALGAG